MSSRVLVSHFNKIKFTCYFFQLVFAMLFVYSAVIFFVSFEFGYLISSVCYIFMSFNWFKLSKYHQFVITENFKSALALRKKLYNRPKRRELERKLKRNGKI